MLFNEKALIKEMQEANREGRVHNRKPRTRRPRKTYDSRLKRMVDIVLFEDPHDPKFYKHTCWWPLCKKVFWSDNPHIRYCCDHHRALHQNQDSYEGARWMSRYSRVGGRATEESLEY